jgi:hypothetical protein
VLVFRLADKQQQPCHSAAVPSQAANQFYQSLFSNSPLAILLQQFFSLQQSSLQQSSPQQFPFSQKTPSSKSFPHPKASCPPSVSLLYPVVSKEVEQQFSGRGMTL